MTKALSCLARTGLISTTLLLANCASYKDGSHVLVSVKDQRMVLMHYGDPVKTWPVSTSKYGLGDKPGSYRTPLGEMAIYKKIGGGFPNGAVFKSRRPTGEVVKPNSPGRDPIVTRILWLEGKERSTRNARRRCIYIHGTPEERNIGRPVSYGCIRMKSRDVADLYKRVREETPVLVTKREIRLAEVPPREKELYAAVAIRNGKPAPPMRGLDGEEILAAASPYSEVSRPVEEPRPQRASEPEESSRRRLLRR